MGLPCNWKLPSGSAGKEVTLHYKENMLLQPPHSQDKDELGYQRLADDNVLHIDEQCRGFYMYSSSVLSSP